MAETKYIILGGLILLLLFGCVNNGQNGSQTTSQKSTSAPNSLDKIGDADVSPQAPSAEVTLPQESAVLSQPVLNETYAVDPINQSSDLVLAGEDIVIEPQ